MRPTRSKPDYTLITLVAILLVFGVIMITSASGPLAVAKFHDSFFFAKRHLLNGILPGIVAFLITSRIDYFKWQKLSWLLYGATLLILALVFVPGLGQSFGKTQSWISIAGISVQTSELGKLGFTLALAGFLAKRGARTLASITQGLVPFLIFFGIVLALLIKQPDVGTATVYMAIAGVMYFVAGAPWIQFAGLGAAGLAGVYVLIKAAPYRAARLTVFLHPELDPQGVGYHVNQALLAIGSGGIFGLGLGQSRQKFQYLPEVAGDSIFAVIGEELGFFLSSLVIILIVAIGLRILKIAREADEYGRLVAIGIAAWFFFQSLANIGAMVTLLPLVGLPLPFVSFGGTAMVTNLAALGVLVNISRSRS